MLADYIRDLVQAIRDKDTKRQEHIYRDLWTFGMDRHTAKVLASEWIQKEKQNADPVNRSG